MTEKQLYRRSDEVLGPYLMARGFDIVKPADYSRQAEGGRDRIGVSRARGRRGLTHFLVALSYYPAYMDVIEDIFDVKARGEDIGFPCGPYLNPVTVGPREKYWSYRSPEILESSLSDVLDCLQDVGLPWLESLRDVTVFAENIDPVATLPSALANEVAGNLEAARRFYQEMYRRLKVLLERFGEDMVLIERGKPFVFVTAKLGIEQDRRERFQETLGYHPNIEPLR